MHQHTAYKQKSRYIFSSHFHLRMDKGKRIRTGAFHASLYCSHVVLANAEAVYAYVYVHPNAINQPLTKK